MKGLGELIGFVLVTMIVVVTIGIVLAFGLPFIDSSRDTGIINEAQHNMLVLDNVIKQVASEGTGSEREVQLSVNDGTYRASTGLNSLDFEYTLKNPVLSRGTFTKVGNLVTTVSGVASATQNSTNLVIENEILKVVFTKVGSPGDFGGINTSNIINTITSKSDGAVLIPNDTSILVEGIANTSWGLGYTQIAREGNNLPSADMLAHVRSNMTGVEYEVLYSLPASADFLLINVMNATSNKTTVSFTYRLGSAGVGSDVIKIGDLNETTFAN